LPPLKEVGRTEKKGKLENLTLRIENSDAKKGNKPQGRGFVLGGELGGETGGKKTGHNRE